MARSVKASRVEQTIKQTSVLWIAMELQFILSVYFINLTRRLLGVKHTILVLSFFVLTFI